MDFNSTYPLSAAWVAVLVAMVAPVSAARPDGNAPESRPVAPEATRVHQLAARAELRLGSDGESPARFTCKIDVSAPGLDPMTVVVERDGPDVAILGTGPGGLPYFYATRHLVVKIDSTSPGRLRVADGAEFDLLWTADPVEKADRFRVMLNAAEKSQVKVDPAALLRSLLQDPVRADTVPEERSIRVEADRAVAFVVPAVEGSGTYPLERLTVRLKSGAELTLREVRVGAAAAAAGSILGRTAGDFAGLGLEVVAGPWKPGAADRQTPVTPAKFWASPENARAGRALATRFAATAVAATRPVGGPKLDPKALREGGAQALGLQSRVLKEIDVAADRRGQVERLFAERRAQIETASEGLAAGDLTPEEALRRTAAAVATGPRLREVLTGTQYQEFVRRWMTAPEAGTGPDPIREMLATLLTEAARLDLSELQRDELTALLTGVQDRSEALRRAAILGQVGRSEVRQATADMTELLVGGLKRILAPGQYATLEAAIRDQVNAPATRPAASPRV